VDTVGGGLKRVESPSLRNLERVGGDLSALHLPELLWQVEQPPVGSSCELK
jgi:hypothetical protein